MNVVKMIAMYRAYFAGAPLGDVVVLKLDAYPSPKREVTQRLEPLRGYVPVHDLEALRRLPAGTLGREYARFLDMNGIEPLVISVGIKERFRERPYPLRYTTTHDLHHVLTGFDTGLAGELGALAFYVGQGSAPIGRALLWVGRILYTLLSPTQARELWRNARVGLEMGEAAELVIAQPLESWFEEPLCDVQAKLRIPEPYAAGILPSGRSVIGDLIYPKKKPAERAAD
jgi:ubiquinone biosynthesis protein Coq4